MKKLLLRVSEAADVLGIGRTMAYDLVRTGDIPSILVGSRIRVPRAELETKIAVRVAEAVAERNRVLVAFGKGKA